MEIITELTTINYLSLFLKIFTILIGAKAIISVLEWFCEKLGLQNKWTRNKRKEHDLLIKTTQGLSLLQQKHDESVRQSIRHDEMLKTDISSLTDTVNGIAATLHGGPGSPIPFSVGCRGMFPEFTERFLMVYWDQLGCGINNYQLDSRFTVDFFVEMAADLIVEVKKMFPGNPLILFGMSWQ